MPEEFICLIGKIKKLESTIFGFGGETVKQEKRIELYSEYSFKPLQNLQELSIQYQDYLNTHLWEELESPQLP